MAVPQGLVCLMMAHHGLVELLRQVPRGLQVDDVVVAEFLALKLLAVGHALARAVAVQRGFLVRVLAVAQIESLVEGEPQRLGKSCARGEVELIAFLPGGGDALQRRRNRRIVGRRGSERLLCQAPFRLQRERSAARLHLLCDRVVIAGRGHNSDVLKIFCRRTHHRRAANVDVLDDVVELDARLGDGLLEGVQIDHDHVDRLDAVLGDGGAMLRVIADVQDAAMHLGMQSLDATVEHFRKAGEVGNVLHGDAGVAQ